MHARAYACTHTYAHAHSLSLTHTDTNTLIVEYLITHHQPLLRYLVQISKTELAIIKALINRYLARYHVIYHYIIIYITHIIPSPVFGPIAERSVDVARGFILYKHESVGRIFKYNIAPSTWGIIWYRFLLHNQVLEIFLITQRDLENGLTQIGQRGGKKDAKVESCCVVILF